MTEGRGANNGTPCAGNIDQVLGISQEGVGALISEKIPQTLVKWLTYVLVLHPVGESPSSARLARLVALSNRLGHGR